MKAKILISLFLTFISTLEKDSAIIEIINKKYKNGCWDYQVDEIRKQYLKIDYLNDRTIYSYYKDSLFHIDSFFSIVKFKSNDSILYTFNDTCILLSTIGFKIEDNEIKIKKYMTDTDAVDAESYYYFIDSVGLISIKDAWSYFVTFEYSDLTSNLVDSLLLYFKCDPPPPLPGEV